MDIKEILHKDPSKRWFSNEIQSLLTRADAEGAFTACDACRYFAGQA